MGISGLTSEAVARMLFQGLKLDDEDDDDDDDDFDDDDDGDTEDLEGLDGDLTKRYNTTYRPNAGGGATAQQVPLCVSRQNVHARTRTCRREVQ